MAEKQTAKNSKTGSWKLVIGLIVIVVILGFIVFMILQNQGKNSPSKYKAALSGYYQALTKGDTNTIAKLTVPNLTDDLTTVKFLPGKYELFAYHFENIVVTNMITNSNAVQPVAKILYSISTFEEKTKVSYLNEAYFIMPDSNAKIIQIKKLYTGEDITK